MKTHKKARYVLAVVAAAALGAPLIAQTASSPKDDAAAKQPTSAPAVAPQEVVLTVGDDKVTAKEFDDFIGDLPPQVQMMAQGPAKRMVADELVKVKLLAQEAEKRGLEKSPKFQRQMQLMKEQLLASEVANSEQQSVDDAAIKKYYDEHPAEFEQVKARHILIRSGVPASTQPGAKPVTDEEAKAKIEAVRKRIVDGKEDFAKVAKEVSDDKHSGEEGGELGTFGHGMMVPQFEQAAFALKPGEISQPVKTQFGYHLIEVEEKTKQPFDQVKDELKQKLGPEKVDQLVNELKKKNKVELNEKYFGPPAPAGAGLPGLPPQ